MAETKGLSQHEMVALVTVMQNSFIAMEGVSAYSIKEDMNKVGFTDIAISLALKALRQKDMLVLNTSQDERGYNYSVYYVTKDGEQWLLDNQEKLVLKEEKTQEDPYKKSDLPF